MYSINFLTLNQDICIWFFNMLSWQKYLEKEPKMRKILSLIGLLILIPGNAFAKKEIFEADKCPEAKCCGEKCQAKNVPKEDIRTPEALAEFGIERSRARFSGKRDLDMSRLNPFIRVERRMLSFMYIFLKIQTPLTTLDFHRGYVLQSDALEDSNLDINARLTANWNPSTSFGLRFILLKTKKSMLHLKLEFEQNVQDEAKVKTADITMPDLVIDLSEYKDSVDIAYKMKGFNSELRFDYALGRFYPYINIGFLYNKTDVEISYEKDLTDNFDQLKESLSDLYDTRGMHLPRSINRSIYAPLVGLGTEINIWGPLSLNFGFYFAPYFANQSYWIMQGGFIVKE